MWLGLEVKSLSTIFKALKGLNELQNWNILSFKGFLKASGVKLVFLWVHWWCDTINDLGDKEILHPFKKNEKFHFLSKYFQPKKSSKSVIESPGACGSNFNPNCGPLAGFSFRDENKFVQLFLSEWKSNDITVYEIC